LPELSSSQQQKRDEQFLKRALNLAARGRGKVSPNPMVGAIVVKEGKIIGEGYHKLFGGPHAEINALNAAGDAAAGGTIYLNFEPCVHHGKTPPCTEAIFKAGIARVVIGMRDPNPLVNGQGVTYLRSKGIKVVEDVLYDKCVELNAGFIKFITTGKPLVTLKIAQTLDGRIATSTGHSKWITAEQSRTMAHRLRAQHDAIFVGIGTILNDDPQLTVRYAKGLSPRRFILDSLLKIPLDAKVLSKELSADTTILTTEQASREKITRIEEKGAFVTVLGANEKGWIDLKELWAHVADLGITSVFIEGGSTVQTACLKGGYVDKIFVFVAPKLLGSGIDAIGDLGIRNINSALLLENVQFKRLEEDLMITADIKK
jgi:diaminohydroxyphosphoribosylaminopyrimidine deaminase / 5-amino-6-(5-phosphoribosylamino)uracil reductase